MKFRLTTREIANLALLAACNAALELTLGNFLHATRFPLAGSLMVGLNLVVYSVGYLRVPRRGAILAIGLGTAFLNFALTGAFKLLALPAIVLEAAILDAVISSGGLNRLNLVLAGVLSNLFTLAWSLALPMLLSGMAPSAALERLVHGDLAAHFPILGVLAILVAARVLVGVLFALLAWRVLGLVAPAARKGAEA